ncbi:MAG: Rne/Rng family ribonuclease [Candidatus Babeliales bacterium]
MKKIIVKVNPWQTKVAILRDGELQNIYFSSPVTQPLERSFFKGIVNKVLPGIQTAFVDIGQEKAGFLHISEIDRELALQRMSQTVEVEEIPGKTTREERSPTLNISKILKEGEAILVQVSKEPVYEKGAKLTTCFTLPGRFIVLMPNIPRIAISKKIEDRDERNRLKELLISNLPDGMGAIIRTTSEGKSDREILRDLKYSVTTWNTILKRYQAAQPQEKIYEDLPIPLRIVRDHLDEDVEDIIIDNKHEQAEIYKFVKTIAPEFTQRVHYYSGPEDIFERLGVNKQIEEALSIKVNLKSGGSIIIEQTQAMTVIDVNTGKYIGKADLEETILKTNLEAAEEVVRQLRLRNIGGLIVIDFIDMATAANRQKLLKFFEKTLKERDKFQSVLLKVSEFGLLQMTRKRSGKTLLQELMDTCIKCHGLGVVKSLQTQCYTLLAKIKKELEKHKNKAVIISLNPNMFEYITTVEYNSIFALEKEFNTKITLASDDSLGIINYKIENIRSS